MHYAVVTTPSKPCTKNKIINFLLGFLWYAAPPYLKASQTASMFNKTLIGNIISVLSPMCIRH